ncbi:hypothetical protein FEM03_24065 [Phragmitibacter flavus]|uniref:Uncharacterized protein n=1 Tax=Phragmitibacter flavus TaxID=2576071 RepID=A0A5R8K9I5_9BACT|nr:hypothetical protein [Phragmitibacter flavus]TLD68169.1 hypothetical protein FEM03_24065 [Phragmitibacter flavus]
MAVGAMPGAGGEVAKRRGPNPALIYWQAQALLPELTKAQEQLPTDVAGGRLAADAPMVGSLLELVRPGLERFKRASASTAVCDWGITLEEGPFAVMPHMARMQFMCRLALLKAEHSFVSKKPKEALEWVLVVHRAARHLGNGEMLTTVLAEYSMESLALRATARHLAGLDSNTRIGHRQQLDLLPELDLVSEALRGEQSVAEWLHRMLLGIEQVPDHEAALKALTMAAAAIGQPAGGESKEADEASASQLLESWKAHHEVIGKAFERLRVASGLPWEKALEEIRMIQADQTLTMPAAQNLFSLIENHLRKRLEAVTQQRMLKAALTLGPDLAPGVLPEWKDAFFEESLIVRLESGSMVIRMRQSTGPRDVFLRLGPVKGP